MTNEIISKQEELQLLQSYERQESLEELKTQEHHEWQKGFGGVVPKKGGAAAAGEKSFGVCNAAACQGQFDNYELSSSNAEAISELEAFQLQQQIERQKNLGHQIQQRLDTQDSFGGESSVNLSGCDSASAQGSVGGYNAANPAAYTGHIADSFLSNSNGEATVAMGGDGATNWNNTVSMAGSPNFQQPNWVYPSPPFNLDQEFNQQSPSGDKKWMQASPILHQNQKFMQLSTIADKRLIQPSYIILQNQSYYESLQDQIPEARPVRIPEQTPEGLQIPILQSQLFSPNSTETPEGLQFQIPQRHFSGPNSAGVPEGLQFPMLQRQLSSPNSAVAPEGLQSPIMKRQLSSSNSAGSTEDLQFPILQSQLSNPNLAGALEDLQFPFPQTQSSGSDLADVPEGLQFPNLQRRLSSSNLAPTPKGLQFPILQSQLSGPNSAGAPECLQFPILQRQLSNSNSAGEQAGANNCYRNDNDLRRHDRMLKNRVAAARSRERKQEYMHNLETQARELKEEIGLLKEENHHLKNYPFFKKTCGTPSKQTCEFKKHEEHLKALGRTRRRAYSAPPT